MRLVVTFAVPPDSECAGYEKVLAVEYESAEAFLVHFDEAMKTYIAAATVNDKAFDKWQSKEPRNDRGPAWLAWAEHPPPKIPPSDQWLDLGGLKFLLNCFLLSTHPYDYALPTVETVEEWFERKLRQDKLTYHNL